MVLSLADLEALQGLVFILDYDSSACSPGILEFTEYLYLFVSIEVSQ